MPTLYVAHYGHPMLKGAKHWSFHVPKSDSPGLATLYQTTGSTETYVVKEPEVKSPQSDTAFMGQVELGFIEDSRLREMEDILMNQVPVKRGSLQWNCQNWVVEALDVLKKRGFNVTAYPLGELQGLLAKAPY